MKHIITIISVLIIFGGNIYAQGGNYHHKREEIKKKKYEFIKNKLQLTEKEKKEFLPLYKEFDTKKEQLYDQKRKTMMNFRQNSLNMNNDDLNAMIDKFVDLDIQIAKQGKIYYTKFKAVLSPMKIILLHQTENEFKKLLLKGAHGRRP